MSFFLSRDEPCNGNDTILDMQLWWANAIIVFYKLEKIWKNVICTVTKMTLFAGVCQNLFGSLPHFNSK